MMVDFRKAHCALPGDLNKKSNMETAAFSFNKLQAARALSSFVLFYTLG